MIISSWGSELVFQHLPTYWVGKVSVLIIEQGQNELNDPLILNPFGVFDVQNFPAVCQTVTTNSDKSAYDTRISLLTGTTWGFDQL